jgi:predicted site-specific integrase-resolvase
MLPDKPWFFVTEAAELLGVSRRTIYNWIEAGKLEVCGCKYYQKVSRVSLLLQGGRR